MFFISTMFPFIFVCICVAMSLRYTTFLSNCTSVIPLAYQSLSIWMLLTVNPCIMLESCLKGKHCCKWYSCFYIKLLPGFNMFRCRFYNSSYINSVPKTRNIFVECGNVCKTFIPQFINAVDRSIIFINPF